MHGIVVVHRGQTSVDLAGSRELGQRDRPATDSPESISQRFFATAYVFRADICVSEPLLSARKRPVVADPLMTWDETIWKAAGRRLGPCLASATACRRPGQRLSSG
jgi:hypothetical protein